MLRKEVVGLILKPLSSVAFLILMVISLGYQPQLEFTVEDAFNNPRRRADYKPLYSRQYPAVPQEHPDYFKEIMLSNFNYGGPSGDELQTDLTPLLSGGRDVRDYQNAGCYWLTDNDEVKLNWETVLKVRTDELKPEDKYFAACYGTRGGYHPYDNRLPKIDGSEFSTTIILLPLVKLEAVTAPNAGDRFNACISRGPVTIQGNWMVSEPGPGLAGECAPERNGLRAGCMLEGCSFKVAEDTTFLHSLISPASGSIDLENSENNTLSEETLGGCPRTKIYYEKPEICQFFPSF